MKVVTHNVNKYMDHADAVTSIHLASEGAGIVYLQEIYDEDDHLAMHEALPSTEWSFINEGRRTPIAVKSASYTILGEGWLSVHPERVGITTERFLSYGIVRRANDDQLLYLLNVHAISGAFSTHPGWTQEMYDWTLDMWNLYYKRVKEHVVFWAQTEKIAVITAGDFNRSNTELITSYSTFVGEHNVDHICVTPVTSQLKLNKILGSGTIETPSDHDAVWADFYLGL